MGIDPPPAPQVTPPVYNYSNEITGGTTPGGAVVRRDTTCTGGTPTTTDNTKGHMWVTPPLAQSMSISDAALSLSTQTFNGATADAMVCVAFYDVPGSITNLVASPPTLLVSKGGPITGLTDWPHERVGGVIRARAVRVGQRDDRRRAQARTCASGRRLRPGPTWSCSMTTRSTSATCR